MSYGWDWDRIKNTTDKYKKTAMKIKKFKYNIMEEIEPFIRRKSLGKQFSTDGKWAIPELLF